MKSLLDWRTAFFFDMAPWLLLGLFTPPCQEAGRQAAGTLAPTSWTPRRPSDPLLLLPAELLERLRFPPGLHFHLSMDAMYRIQCSTLFYSYLQTLRYRLLDYSYGDVRRNLPDVKALREGCSSRQILRLSDKMSGRNCMKFF